MNTEPVDPAVQAFEALRMAVAEIGAMLAAQHAMTTKPAPDYDLTLGRIAKQLGELTAGIAAIEAKPALSLTASSFEADFQVFAREASKEAAGSVRLAAYSLERQVKELQTATGNRLSRSRLSGWLAASGVLGLCVGIALCLGTMAAFPSQVESWMATTIVGGSPWEVGQILMRRADHAAYERMVRLSKACGDNMLELCEAGITVRTMPPFPDIPAPSVVFRERRSQPAAGRQP